jgi:hypothetical protein
MFAGAVYVCVSADEAGGGGGVRCGGWYSV